MDADFNNTMRKIEDARSQFNRLFYDLSPAELIEVTLSNGWSAKDLLGHVTYWDQYLIDWLNERDEEVTTWDEVHRRNELNYQTKKDWAWLKVKTDAETTFVDMLALLKAFPVDRLADESVQKNIAVSTFDHYSEHQPELETAITEWRNRRSEA